jgi:hypothetical protein
MATVKTATRIIEATRRQHASNDLRAVLPPSARAEQPLKPNKGSATMVYWIAKLSTHLGPSYLAIADEIEKAIRDGALKSGSRLPSQRLLADFLGLHVNTVNRAMRETARRGLTAGATRRGTVVLARSP